MVFLKAICALFRKETSRKPSSHYLVHSLLNENDTGASLAQCLHFVHCDAIDKVTKAIEDK